MGVSDLKAKAREAFKRKSYEHAVEIYVEALQFEADDAEIYDGFLQATTKAREGRGRSLFGGMGKLALGAVREPGKRLVAAARHLAKNPDDKGAWMSVGEAGEAGGHLNAAQFGYRTAAKLDPEDNEAWKRLGAVLYRLGRIKEAMEAYDQAVRIDPKDQEALKMRKNLAAEGALKMSGYETAKSSRDLIRDKDVAGRLERDTRLQMTEQDATDEAARLRGEIARDPGSALRTRTRLAEVLLQKGDRAGALAEMLEVQRLDPSNYDLTVRIGDMRLTTVQETFDKAKAAYQSDASDANRAALEKARADLLEARLAEFGRRVREHPTDLSERYKYGATLLMANRVDEAIGEFQKTVADPRRKTDSLLRLGECFEKKNLLDLAAKQIAKAAEDYPTLAGDRAKEIVYRLAELHERRGAKADALREYTRIYEVDIGFRDVAAKIAALSG
jgi:tetratricopeptide (TPR) repeat protein